MRIIYTLVFLMCGLTLFAQETFPVNGVQDERDRAYAFTNATIYTSYQRVVENATLLIRDGKVVQVGSDVDVPDGYITINLEGKYIYPGLIDPYTTYGIPEPEESQQRGVNIEPVSEGAYNANDAVRAHYSASEEFTVNSGDASSMRKLGFGSVLSYKPDGLARGSSVFVTLGDDTENKVILLPKAAAHYSFDKGTSAQYYPSSTMGYIAVLRQTYLDADWYSKLNPKPFTDQTLDAWLELQALPQVFETSGWMTALRANKVGDEFGVQYTIVGGGDEYQRLDDLKNTGAAFIIPLDFPDAFDVEDPFDAEDVSLEDMKHWELAPANPAFLEEKGIEFSLTTHGLENKSKFWTNLRKAVEYGLSKETALKAITHNPASLYRVSDRVGALAAGYEANFIITSGDLFEEDTRILDNWIQGHKYMINDPDEVDYAGKYTLEGTPETYALEVTGQPGSHKAKLVINDSVNVNVNLKIDESTVTMSFNPNDTVYTGDFRLSGWFTGEQEPSGLGWQGKGQSPEGEWFDWTATYQTDASEDDDSEVDEEEEKEEEAPQLGDIIYPFTAYGTSELPQQETILIRNATVWTNEDDGILENTDVLLEEGKIRRIGKNLNAREARVIDGTGKYLTPGIIDEHSHIAASSINDRATNSSMVRIGDVVDSESISIYRALAGGVTAIQILHGSANPIGGQSALIKLRWGHAPEQLKIEGADNFIKFALGENPKRVAGSARYPDTRMGVEQVYVDAFSSARDYQKKWNAYNRLSSGARASATPPRKDLAMEAMAEILNSERFISCHSYVQSEINMLMKVAERFDFRVNTFTHILEGYKVADKMAAHGAGGSTFSDWWAYKWEVRYAIPYNAALMHREGVVTAINSDDSEMMRRLNQEAAKSIKYGNIPEQDAFKMVTLNPARLLHLDDRMGSIKRGKDADVVLWSDHPLSVYARVEKTIIDGTVYFDIDKDAELRKAISAERARLIAKMRGAKKNGASTRKPQRRVNINLHCDDMVELK